MIVCNVARLGGLAVCLAVLGCGGPIDGYPVATSKSAEYTAGSFDSVESEVEVAALEDSELGASSAVTTTASSVADRRRIIYSTEIGLVVDDYTHFESQLPAITRKHGGFIASSETDRSFQDRQSGIWVVRVPVKAYADFLRGVQALGFAESRRENAQDVSEEYVDVEARIKNKRTLEDRIVTLLEERNGKLPEILEIERELSRVREEIERMEGRIRYLRDRTSLATLTIRCREQQEYTPPEAPNFGSRVAATWSDSIRLLRLTAEKIVLALTAIIPWVVIGGVLMMVAWILLGRRWRSRPSIRGKRNTSTAD